MHIQKETCSHKKRHVHAQKAPIHTREPLSCRTRDWRKRDLCTNKKRPVHTKRDMFTHKRHLFTQENPFLVTLETDAFEKRHMHKQKRPIHTKETYWRTNDTHSHKRTPFSWPYRLTQLKKDLCTHKKRPVHTNGTYLRTNDTHTCHTRDLYILKKNPVFVTKETCIRYKRDLIISTH